MNWLFSSHISSWKKNRILQCELRYKQIAYLHLQVLFDEIYEV